MTGRTASRTATAALVALTVTALAVLGAPRATAEPARSDQTSPHEARSDRTSPHEARRVDRVPTPDPGWTGCEETFPADAQCGSVTLPMDYDQPRGATVEVALLRIPATDPARRIGTLFVNPGGPGASGVQMAADAPSTFDPDLLARFDVVGFDPRGIGRSTRVQCFRDVAERDAVLDGLMGGAPLDAEMVDPFVADAEAFGRACSTTGAPLSGSMSTAQVARDLDVLRRAVGDTGLTYFGQSYGSVLGSTYANLFPDRVRALVIDGVTDPTAWAGTPATASVPLGVRMRAGEGSARAMQELLDRCEKAGPDVCPFAEPGDATQEYRRLLDTVKADPILTPFPRTYAYEVGMLSFGLAQRDPWNPVLAELADLRAQLDGRDQGTGPAPTTTEAPDLVEGWPDEDAPSEPGEDEFLETYSNLLAARFSTACADSLDPRTVRSHVRWAARADADAPDFGPSWAWVYAPCADATWTIRDEDAYRGPFHRSTARPVLVIGNLWDPATNYDNAVRTAGILGNARLLTSDSWGHTAYGTSACLTGAVSRYLVDGVVPARGTVCVGDVQPFAPPSFPPFPTGS